jgi:hypothetical protein
MRVPIGVRHLRVSPTECEPPLNEAGQVIGQIPGLGVCMCRPKLRWRVQPIEQPIVYTHAQHT